MPTLYCLRFSQRRFLMKSLNVLFLLLLVTTAATAQIAPTGFTLDAVSNTEIKLSWTHDGKGIDKFVIEKSTDGTVYKVLTNLAITDRSYADKGLTANTVYYYRIYSALGTRNSGTVFNKATTLSNPPTGFGTTTITPIRIDLVWNSGGTPTQLEYSKNADFSAATTKNFTTQQTGFADGLTPNTGYYFRLKRTTFNGAQESDWVQIKATTQDPKPASPTGFAVTGKNTNSIGVKWNAVSGVEGYQARRADVADFTRGVVTQDISFLQTTYTYPSLNDNTTYYLQVRAKNTISGTDYWSDWSSTLKDATDLGPPFAPTGVQATPTSPTQVDVTWADNSDNEENFIISRSPTSSAGPWTEAGRVGANIKTFTDNGVQPNTTYYYQVCAVNKASQTCALSAKINTPIQTPTAPTALAVSISGTTATLTWKDNSSNEIDYEIQRKEGNGAFADFGKTGSFNGAGTFIDTKLFAGRTYCYRVRATNAGGPSDYSNEACASTAPAAPNAPNNLQLTLVSVSQVDLSWTDGGGATDFEVQRADGLGGYAKINTLSAGRTTYSDNSIQQGKTYSYRINATNVSGNALSEVKTISIPTVPPAPEYSLQVLSSTDIKVDYRNTAGANATALELQYALNNGFTIGLGGQNVPIAGSTVTISSLQPSTRYFFRLRASNSGTGLASDWVLRDAQTQPNAPQSPAAPTNLAANPVSDSEIALTWTDNSDETGFEVERSPDGITGWINIGTTAANATSFRNTGLSASTRYGYRVRAVRASLFSAYSNTVTATTSAPPAVIPAAPVNFKATAASSSQINLIWNAANGLTGYKLEYADNAAFTNLKTETGVAATATSFSVQNLLASTTYYFRLYAINSAGSSPAVTADARTDTPPVTKPNEPTNLNLTGSSDGKQITVGWTDASSNEDRFAVQYAETADFANPTSTSVGAGVGTFTITNRQPCGTYFVRVSAANNAGSSGWIDGKITLNPTLPVKASGFTATAASQIQINLVLTYAANTEEAFELEYATNSSYTSSTKRDLAKTSRAETVTGLTASTPYWFRLRAKNCAGNGEWLETTAITQANTPQPPASPTNLGVTALSPSVLALAWTDNATNEDAYELDYSTNASFTSGLTQVRLSAGASSTQLTGLLANTTYYVRVRAVNSAGSSGWLTGSGTTQAVVPTTVATPTNLRFATTAPVFTQLSLLWIDVAINETGYEVWRAENDQTNWVSIAELAVNTAAFTDNGLRPSIPYFYRVRAVQNAVYSDWSNVITDRAPLVSAVNLPAEVQVYPNPTSDLLTIDCPSGGSGTVQIRSVAGLTVLEQPFTSVAGRLLLDLRALPTGLYVVVVSTATTRFSTRLLKR
nr:hypothetical protein A6C57_08275 [Fibrella sp. ES10-3-2-2]